MARFALTSQTVAVSGKHDVLPLPAIALVFESSGGTEGHFL